MEDSVSVNIKAINRLRDEAFKTGDIWDYIDYFTDDTVWMPDGEAALLGKEAVRAWATRFDGQTFKFRIVPEEVVVAGDWAFDRFIEIMVPVSSTGEEGDPSYYRAFWTLRRQVNGSWKITHYIWNNHPPIS